MLRWMRRTASIVAVLLSSSAFSAPAAQEVKLILRNPAGLRHAAWPMTTGVPFPQGALVDAARIEVLDPAGRPVPVQTRATAAWDAQGSSIRWLLLDMQADLNGDAEAVYTLRFGDGVKPTNPPNALTVTDVDGRAWRVATGPLTLAVRRDRFDGIHEATLGRDPITSAVDSARSGPYVVDSQGREFRASACAPDEVTVEEQGPLRCVLCAKGWLAAPDGQRHGRYITRIHAYAGQSFVKVLHTFIITDSSDQLKYGDIGFAIPLKTTGATFGIEGSAGRQVDLARPAYLLQYDCDRAVVAKAGDPVTWEAAPAVKRSTGWVQASTGSGAMATLACRDFWQQFPKEFEADARGLTFHAWPAHGIARPDRTVTDASLQYAWFCHEGRVLDFAVPADYYGHKERASEDSYRYVRSAKDADALGLAKTHELLLWFHDAAGAGAVGSAAEKWQEDPVLTASPEWMCSSGVFGPLHPFDAKRFPDVESKMSRAWDCEQRLEAQTRDYGMFHWGDGHHLWDFSVNRWSDTYRCWRGFHHGTPRVSWLLFFRSGDLRYWRHALRNARHCMDIDLCNYSTPASEALPYPKGKIAGALNDYKGIVHWHSGNRLFDYNCLTDFMLWYSCMTGDARGRDTALLWGEAVKSHWKGELYASRQGAGLVSSLVEVYRQTWDPAYLKIIDAHMRNYFDKVQILDVSKEPPERGLKVGAFPGLEHFAPWITRYYDLTHGEEAGKRIVLWADAYMAGNGGYMTLNQPPSYTDILAYAYFINHKPEYLSRGVACMDEFLNSIADKPGDPFDGYPSVDVAPGAAYSYQHFPYLLAALADYGRPVKADTFYSARPFSLPQSIEVIGGKKNKCFDFLVLDEQDAAFRLRVPGVVNYAQWSARSWVKSPSGKTVSETETPLKQKSFEQVFTVPVDGEKGGYALRVFGVGNYWGLQTPVQLEPPMKMVLPITNRNISLDNARLYFFVPEGATRLRVVVKSSKLMSFQLVPPDAETGFAFSVLPNATPEQRRLEAPVTREQTGGLWMIRGQEGSGSFQLEADGAVIPPYVALSPQQWFQP